MSSEAQKKSKTPRPRVVLNPYRRHALFQDLMFTNLSNAVLAKKYGISRQMIGRYRRSVFASLAAALRERIQFRRDGRLFF